MMRNSWTRISSTLRGTLAGLLLAGVFVSCVAPMVSAAVNATYLAVKPLKWTVCSSGTCLDSTYKTLSGSPASNNIPDTTNVVDTTDWDWSAWNNGATLTGAAKIWIVANSGAVASTDTILVGIDASPDKVHWQIVVAPALMAFATANDAVASYPITFDTDVVTATAFGAHYLRFRFRPDAASGATFPNAIAYLAYPKRTGTP
jgi:hypothetical protein